jgi:hypothetical protein
VVECLSSKCKSLSVQTTVPPPKKKKGRRGGLLRGGTPTALEKSYRVEGKSQSPYPDLT